MKPAFDHSIVHDIQRFWWMLARLLLWRVRGLVLAGLISVCLVSCTPSSGPPRAVVLDALALQIELTQTSIARTLELPPSIGHPTVSRVRIEEQSVVKMGAHNGVHLLGRFDWQLPGDRIQVDSPFDLYLEQGDKKQSWRLAQQADPSGASELNQQWLTYPLPLA